MKFVTAVIDRQIEDRLALRLITFHNAHCSMTKGNAFCILLVAVFSTISFWTKFGKIRDLVSFSKGRWLRTNNKSKNTLVDREGWCSYRYTVKDE